MNIIRVIDFETTGDKPPAQVCEVGLCDIIVESLIVKPPVSWLCGVNEMPPVVRAVHHITLAECEGQPPFNYRPLEQGATVIAAHNAAFETLFFTPIVPVICTYKSALRIWPEAPSHSNGALCYWLEDQGKIKLNKALAGPTHRAGPDAYVTAHILKAMLVAGHTARDMVAWTREPPMMPRCPIGKARGKPWAEVETGFLGWMIRQDDMEVDLKWNAQRELDRRAAA